PTKCEKCGCDRLTREEDVLDTWFSSALWPFSTLGWPAKTQDLDYWYPTSVMVTGYDIIFFWVARMIFSGMEQMKKEPFSTVLIHGLVRDDKGRKMSKSLGNGIDPLEIAEQFGADALRFNLITGNSPGNDMRFFTEKCEAMRNFANKIWNASRYVLMNLSIDECGLPAAEKLHAEDKWVLSKLNTLIRDVTDNMNSYELGVASAKIYDFIWDTYCDWYVELTKARLYADDEDDKKTVQKVLVYVLDRLLRLLHPYMPFITEEIWQAIPHEGDFIMKAEWPVYDEALSFPTEEGEMEVVMEAIRAIRARRAEMNVPPSKKATLYVLSDKAESFRLGQAFISRLAYAQEVVLCDTEPEGYEKMISVVTADAKLYLPLDQLIDLDKERERIAKEKEKTLGEIAFYEKKLSNENFVSRAPEAVVNAERAKLEKAKALLEGLMQDEARLG
ncbi:MAG: class I tRNA ligase family protein, partial [Oscillospiraceae bacterium]|nr:class I tRNA ligase family protein [Oscillospiraceae bacterium]